MTVQENHKSSDQVLSMWMEIESQMKAPCSICLQL